MVDLGRGLQGRNAVTIAVGITTYNRPKFLAKCLRGLAGALRGLDASVWVYNDGSDPRHSAEYQRAYRRLPEASIEEAGSNRGVAYAKNRLLEAMLADGADWLFLLEDDIEITSPDAISAYIDASRQTGVHHLSFAHHGDANASGPVAISSPIEFYPHSVGAWTLYTRQCLEAVGLFDENFHNAWEHVEHELRLVQHGFMPGAGAHRFPDVEGSSLWLREQPSAIERSAIRPRDDWQQSIVEGLAYWREARPDTFTMMFGPGMPLEDYANNTLIDWAS